MPSFTMTLLMLLGRAGSLIRSINKLFRIGWDYQTDGCFLPGLLSEKWRLRRTGEIRFANARH